jgi:uncharacterized membrane protein YeaQ/YmgE (transglycosylase-associated protein family)
MELIAAIVSWACFGLIAGAIARLLVPGHQPLGCLGTILLGVAGSLIGGFASWLLFGGHPLQASGWIMSILGAVLLLALVIAPRRAH